MKRFLAFLLALTLLCTCGVFEALSVSAADNSSVSTAELSGIGFKATSGDKKVTLSWKSVSGAEKYDIYWKRSSSEEWKKAGNTKKTSVTVSGLNNDISYDFKISVDGKDSDVLTLSPSASGTKTVYAPVPESYTCESAADAVKKMGAGYNIGNTFDSRGTWLSANAPVSQHETAWGNPQVTKKFVDSLADLGFDSIRLPVTWDFNTDKDGNVRKEWLKRIKEVVDWIIEDDMYCIINVHHDTGTDGWIHASANSYNSNNKRFAAIWEDIAEYFKDYDDRLLFECFNETLNDYNDWGATDSTSADYIRKYEQLFVDTVRATGGNNATRNLILNTYAASSGYSVVNNFKLPTDTVKGHMIMEVHNYDPAGFVRTEASWTTLRKTWGTSQDKTDIDNLMNYLSSRAKTLGVPVIIGEFGSMNKNNDDDRAKHAAYFVSAATKKGIPVFWWDNGNDSAATEAFKLVDRNTGKCVHEKILKALIENAK